MEQLMCLILDFGGAQAASIARKVRSEKIYCEVLPYDAPIERIARRAPRGIILAGGEGNAFADGAPVLPEPVYALGLPVLALGMSAGVLLRRAGAKPVKSMPGRQTVEVTFDACPLFDGLSESERLVERLDEITLPEGYRSIAHEGGGWSVAFASDERRHYGVQFYPEQNDPDGLRILTNFTTNLCGLARDWTVERILEIETAFIREKVGARKVLMTISGGLDSAVCAALIRRAVGDQLHSVYVDTGFMRKGDNEAVRQAFGKIEGLTLHRVDARERFLNLLSGVTRADDKQRLVAGELTRVFEDYAASLGEIECLARGTTYEEALSRTEDEAHPEMDGFTVLIEPVSRLFKEEVRILGEALALPEEITRQQPFPSAGLAVRCLGQVTERKLANLRMADRIFREEIAAAGLDRRIRQYFAILSDHASSGEGSEPDTVALRAVNQSASTATAYRLPYDLLERVVERITGEVPGIRRVVYDLTGRPPSEIEWN